jgi:hypothetical protein
MTRLFFRANYWQFITATNKFRIYDTEKGYVVLTYTGDKVGVVDGFIEAQQLALAYRG